MPSAAQATVSTIIQPQEPKEPGSFRRYEFGLSGRAVVPSLVYIRPDDLEHVRMIVGPDAELGDQKYPVHKEQMVFGNLKSLFKSDLVLADKEPTWKYKFDRNLGYAETNPITVTREFFRGLLSGLKDIDLEEIRRCSPLYIGKPAYSDSKLERRYEKRLRLNFSELGVPQPAFVYEPYAVYYYCQFLLRMSFIHESTRMGARVLIVDHGGGTINTCIVELNRLGEIRSARPRSPQASHGGGSFIDQFLLRKKIREANFAPEIRKKIIDNEKLVFPRLADVLAQGPRKPVIFV